MNDFTKDELEFMASCMDGEIMYYGTDHIGHLARKKVQSLIDNYCEHSGNIAYHEWKTCNDCGQPFYE